MALGRLLSSRRIGAGPWDELLLGSPYYAPGGPGASAPAAVAYWSGRAAPVPVGVSVPAGLRPNSALAVCPPGASSIFSELTSSPMLLIGAAVVVLLLMRKR